LTPRDLDAIDRAVILVDRERFVEAHPAVAAAIPDGRIFTALPIYHTAADDPGVETVTRIPGVRGVALVSQRQLGVMAGIDTAVLMCLDLADGWTVGGVREGEPYPYLGGDHPRGHRARPAICAAVNMSLSPPDADIAPTVPNDPVNYATWILSGYAVPVLPSGNFRKGDEPYETVSPWAEPPWVLAVGATQDERATIEWARSGRGSAVNRTVGPDVLAWGQNPFRSEDGGTSFAAARITAMVLATRLWLLQVAANIDRLAGRPFGVPLLGALTIDRNFLGDASPPRDLTLKALPVFGSRDGAFAALSSDVTDTLAATINGPLAHGLSRSIVQHAAAATTPPGAQLSAPSLTLERLDGFLDGLSARQLLALVHPLPSARALGADDGEAAIFTPGTSDRMRVVLRTSQPRWEWDIDTKQARALSEGGQTG
jgi:hypothetical protein